MNATIARIRRLTADALPAGDGPLLDAFLAGDQTAFAALVRRHAGPVFATCRRVLRHQQDAEDAFQATFLVLARRAADVWPREAVGSWLFGVAHRVALKARAVRSRRAVREQPLEEVASAERPAPDFDLAEAVHRAVLKLPEVYRAAVVACDLEGLSRKEAAERLGWTEGTLSGRLARARALLARRLRRSGLSLPAGGFAALATTNGASAATVQTTIDLATGTAASASAPVAALTEGVVRSMALLKLKAMAGAVFTACALGFGAFAATGVGDDAPGAQPPGPGAVKPTAKPMVRPEKPAAPQGPRVELAHQELQILRQELKITAKGKIEPELLERLVGRLEAIGGLLDPDDMIHQKPASDRDRLQGSWRVVALTEGDKTTPTEPKDPWVIEVTGGTLRMPYLETEGGWKQRAFSFAVDDGKSPRTIDLVAPNKPVARGIYEFTAPAKSCAACHEVKGKAHPDFRDLPDVCAPGLKAGAAQLRLRLALSIDGKRPAKFGGPGVIVFEMTRPAESNPSQTRWAGNPNIWQKFDATEDNLRLLLADIQQKARTKRLDPQSAEQLKLSVEAVLWMLEESRKASGIDSPTDPAAKAALDLHRAKQAVEEAEALLDKVETDAELTKPQLDYLAKAQLARARQGLAAAEKAVADLKKPLPGAPAKEVEAFTVHVRTLTAAEKLIRVKATGSVTVLDALEYVADDALLKSEGVSSWVVRGKTVLPVDLPGLLKHGKATTNYQLFAGDKLFVQAKPAK